MYIFWEKNLCVTSDLQVQFLYRYLLRRSALELFMMDRSNFFFDFGVYFLKYASFLPSIFKAKKSFWFWDHSQNLNADIILKALLMIVKCCT